MPAVGALALFPSVAAPARAAPALHVTAYLVPAATAGRRRDLATAAITAAALAAALGSADLAAAALTTAVLATALPAVCLVAASFPEPGTVSWRRRG